MFVSPYSLGFNTNFIKQCMYWIQEKIKIRQSKYPLTCKLIGCPHTIKYIVIKINELWLHSFA